MDTQEARKLLIDVAEGKGSLTIEYIVEGAIRLYLDQWKKEEHQGRSWDEEDRFSAAKVILDTFFSLLPGKIFQESVFNQRYFYAGESITKEQSQEEMTPYIKPERKLEIINRIIRDNEKVRELKQLYDYRCCLCEKRIYVADDEWHCEVHHLRPLGEPHNGPDEKGNMLVLCPAHHVQFDHGVPVWNDGNIITIGRHEFQMTIKHAINHEYVAYYRQYIQQ